MNKAYIRILILILAIISGVVVVSIMAESWPPVVVLYIIWIAGWLAWLIRWHAGAYVYQCSYCKNLFSISARKDALSPHMVDTKLLRCPQCGKSDWFKGFERQSIKTEIFPSSYHRSLPVEIDKSLYWQIALILSIYLILWLYTVVSYMHLPDFIPVKSNHIVAMRSKTTFSCYRWWRPYSR